MISLWRKTIPAMIILKIKESWFADFHSDLVRTNFSKILRQFCDSLSRITGPLARHLSIGCKNLGLVLETWIPSLGILLKSKARLNGILTEIASLLRRSSDKLNLLLWIFEKHPRRRNGIVSKSNGRYKRWKMNRFGTERDWDRTDSSGIEQNQMELNEMENFPVTC